MSLYQTPLAKPQVWTWYTIYCILMALLYLLVTIAGALLFLIDPAMLDVPESEAMVFRIQACVFTGLGVPLMILYAAGPFLPQKPWVWIYGIALIGIGMTSVCCLPATIPLLIFWIKPETQQFFGRK